MAEGKGRVCVTGGTGFLGSWIIKRLLEDGYAVNTTIRSDPGRKRDVSFLTNLPGASEKLKIFNADLSDPESFDPAVEGCVGIFHTATPIDFAVNEPEEVVTKRAIDGALGIMKAGLKAKTVKRVVYTSSGSTVSFSSLEEKDVVDESVWSDVDMLRSVKPFGWSYAVSKVLTEKAVLEFGEHNGLEVATVIAPFIVGPFVCPKLPDSIEKALLMVLGKKEEIGVIRYHMVHVDDVAEHSKIQLLCSTWLNFLVQGALVGSYKGSCHLYNTSENKLQQKSKINLQNKKKKSHHKKITGFQFAPGSSSEVLITSADSRIRVVDGVDLVHKFKGFRNATSPISASLTANGKYVVAASEDSHVYIWKNEADCRPNRTKGVTVTRSYEHFHCKDVSVAIPWPGVGDAWDMHDTLSGEQPELDNHADEVASANHPPTPVEENFVTEGSRSASGYSNSPRHATIASATNTYFFDRISATWPEEKLLLATRNQSPRVSMDFSNGVSQKMSAWGMVIVTAGLRGEIRTFQNFGLPLRI